MLHPYFKTPVFAFVFIWNPPLTQLHIYSGTKLVSKTPGTTIFGAPYWVKAKIDKTILLRIIDTYLNFSITEEEDVEVFKVKKSTQSKRLAKKREKEKQKRDGRTDGDNDKYDTIVIEVRWTWEEYCTKTVMETVF